MMLHGLILESRRLIGQLPFARSDVNSGRRRRTRSSLIDLCAQIRSVQSLEDRSLLSAIAAPSITSPGATTTQSQPTIQWTAVGGAVSYDVWINNNTTGVAPFHQASTPSTSYTPSTSWNIGQYSVWVRAEDGQGQKSAWSQRSNFRVTTPTTIQTIAAQQTTARPTLQWAALGGAVRYDFWLDNVTTQQSQYVRIQNLTATSWTAGSDLHLGQYRAWVRGIDASGTASAWSPAVSFSIMPAPGNPIPESSIFNPQPTFSWDGVAGAQHYELTLRDANTGAVVYNPVSLFATNWTPPLSLPQGPHRWTVVAVNANGFRSFSTGQIDMWIGGRPEIVAPVTTTTSTTPTFQWKSVLDAARYELYVSKVGGQGGIINQTNLQLNSYTPSSALSTGQYRFWVRAVSVGGVYSPWSLQANFEIVAAGESQEVSAEFAATGVLNKLIAGQLVPSVTHSQEFPQSVTATASVPSHADEEPRTSSAAPEIAQAQHTLPLADLVAVMAGFGAGEHELL